MSNTETFSSIFCILYKCSFFYFKMDTSTPKEPTDLNFEITSTHDVLYSNGTLGNEVSHQENLR